MTKAVTRMYTAKKIFLEIYLNSQENTCASLIKKEALVQLFSFEFCEISKNTFSYRTPLVAASKLAYVH